MNEFLLERSLGQSGPITGARFETARRIQTISPAPRIVFDSSKKQATDHVRHRSDAQSTAHKSGAQCLTIEHFEGRYALSGGADGSVNLWDLEQAGDASRPLRHVPLGSVPRTGTNTLGVTSISFYPFDPGLFLTSSYDHHLKVYDTNSLDLSASFDLESVLYSHSISRIASHLLVATASQHPAIRLVDLNTGSSVQSLFGHAGPVFSVGWSPRDEHILVSGGSDGTVRTWDVRRSAGCLGVFDLEDSTGVPGFDGLGTGARNRLTGRAHIGACNGVVWTNDGDHIVSTGHDERVRVWDVATGANTLSHFGPHVRNNKLATVLPLPVPKHLTHPHQRLMFYPNEREILMFDMFEGTLLKRLKPPGAPPAQPRSDTGQGNTKQRVTGLGWRMGHLELYSSHSDGTLRAWLPSVDDDDDDDDSGDEDSSQDDSSDQEERSRKRKALDDIFQSLTKKPITFT